MSNIIVPKNLLSPTKYGDADTFNELAKSTSFLPRLQLFGSNSDAVKQGKFPMAHYGLVLSKDQIEDLGVEVNILPITWRPRAMQMSGESPISYFNPKSSEFQAIQEKSEEPDSGCVFGPEFLIYIPGVARFATYFMMSKTSRRQAPELRALSGRGATLRVQYIETKKYSWHGPTVSICSTSFDPPNMEEVERQVNLFSNPEDSSIEFEPAQLEKESTERAR